MIAMIASSTTTVTMSASVSQGTFLPTTGAAAGAGVWATRDAGGCGCKTG